MNKFFALIAVAAFVLTGCNTIKGVGKDVEKAGEVIQNAGSK